MPALHSSCTQWLHDSRVQSTMYYHTWCTHTDWWSNVQAPNTDVLQFCAWLCILLHVSMHCLHMCLCSHMCVCVQLNIYHICPRCVSMTAVHAGVRVMWDVYVTHMSNDMLMWLCDMTSHFHASAGHFALPCWCLHVAWCPWSCHNVVQSCIDSCMAMTECWSDCWCVIHMFVIIDGMGAQYYLWRCIVCGHVGYPASSLWWSGWWVLCWHVTHCWVVSAVRLSCLGWLLSSPGMGLCVPWVWFFN